MPYTRHGTFGSFVIVVVFVILAIGAIMYVFE
jgi:hypothetical protein